MLLTDHHHVITHMSLFLMNHGTNFWFGRKGLEKTLGSQLQIS
jgi:hypothetical protein